MNKLPRFRAIGAVMLCMVALSSLAMAAEEPEIKKKTLLELFETTGPVGYMMVITSVIGTTLTLQYIVQITREKLPHRAGRGAGGLMSAGTTTRPSSSATATAATWPRSWATARLRARATST
jgi:hypothetical protein